MKKTILFDLDGTLIDSTQAIVETFFWTFQQFNINFQGSSKDIEQMIGYPLEDMYQHLGIKQELINDIVLAYKQKYRQISISQTKLLDGAIESLELASSFATLGIVTTKTTQYTMPLLKHLDIWKYFKTIIGRMEVIHPKPHPEPILKALKKLNVTNSNNNVFMIGDTKLDLISANRAKVVGIGVLSGYGTQEDLSQFSPYIVTNSLQAVKFINNFF
jgi:phosphoglycolate phosphatase